MPAPEEEKMSALEKELIDKAFGGGWADAAKLPDFSEPLVPEEADITVRGRFLRELLLGLRASAKDMGTNSRLLGVRLCGAIIEGEIDLSDCTGMNGTPLPPLLLERCIIRGGDLIEWPIGNTGDKQSIRKVINVSNARLSRLSLNDCQVGGRVDLTDATLGGDLEIGGVQPLDKDHPCQIFARRCRVDGSVIASRAHLRIPPGQIVTGVGVADFALNLADAKIQGSLLLQPRFHAEGGVNVGGARVGGDIWAEAAKFGASRDTAFRAQSLQCDGTVALRGKKEGQTEFHCEALGKLDFLGARIGFLDLSGIYIRRLGDLKEPVDQWLLNLYLACVRTGLWLRMDSSVPKTIVEGPIEVRGATVGGDLDLTGLSPPSDRQHVMRILASSLRVCGDLKLDGPDGLIISMDLTSSHVEGNFNLNADNAVAKVSAKYQLVARNITVGNDCKLEAVSGTVDLELSRIGGALTVHAEGLAALNAKEAEVRGSVIISGTFKPLTKGDFLCLDGGTYKSGFLVGENEEDKKKCLIIQLPAASLINQKPLRNFTFSIENACIGNNFRVKEVRVQKEKGAGEIPVIVSLRGLKTRVFHHDPRNSWGEGIKLKLAGFEYDRIDTEGSKTATQVSVCQRWLSQLKRLIHVCAETPQVDAHQRWLSLQEDYATPEGYEPQPYEQLARALRNDGKYEEAKRITFQNLKLERETMSSTWTWLFFFLMEKLFNYGLFPGRSVGLFIGLWIAGTVAFDTANTNHQHDQPVLVRHAESGVSAQPEQPCGKEVNSLLYALDVFVPLLDLKQEDRCSITTRDNGYWWRLFNTLYELLGAIVTPITILSMTGLLRRYIER